MDFTSIVYIVSGDEMYKIMKKKYPDRIIIPFREDLSKGEYHSFLIDEEFINERSKQWNISKDEYVNNMKDIIDIDVCKKYVLVFGEDDCCKANLSFVLQYLKKKEYLNTIDVQIVDEYSLEIIKEYQYN